MAKYKIRYTLICQIKKVIQQQLEKNGAAKRAYPSSFVDGRKNWIDIFQALSKHCRWEANQVAHKLIWYTFDSNYVILGW